MRRITASAVLCVLFVSLAGCALVSDKTKTNKKEKKHQVKVLGVPIWKTEKPVAQPAM
ncbi:MAG: hypothetical protein WCP22_00360 [Chlamydiota bacterium]